MRVLVISAHPDDETMGCGGTLLKHRSAGDTISWVIVTKAFEPRWTAEVIRRKAEEVESVARAYGMEKVFTLGMCTTMLDTVPQREIIEGIHNAACAVQPDCVYLVNRSDVHSDHRAVFEAAAAVFKPWRQELRVRQILCYECLSSTDSAPALAELAFLPNVYSDIGATLDRKLEVMRLYGSEAQPDPLPRGDSAIRALARYRGATIGVEYAEAFMLLRELLP